MWPYTQDEVKWLAMPLERAAAERTQCIVEQRWMAEVGIPRLPAK